LPIASIESIDLTYITAIDSVQYMDGQDQAQEFETEPSVAECECPEPCNCDHENE
jgi:hypothetical protein